TTMQEASLYLLYKLNEKSITEKYCVNKNIKGSCCNGSCHLNKTISKAENENSTNPFSILNLKVKEVEVYLQQFYKINIEGLENFIISSNNKINYSAAILKGVTQTPIKPPTVLA
ncbi:MAG TPA: hypothetical protein PK431_17580, partial [Chitinophagales bacterium]|nr:hypothetical protein [Chitinophagales bacterium]